MIGGVWLWFGGSDGTPLGRVAGPDSAPELQRRSLRKRDELAPRVSPAAPGVLKEWMLKSDGLMKAYLTGGVDGVARRLETVGPGIERRKLIHDFLWDAGFLEGGLGAREFGEIFRLIDSLPFPEDKAQALDADVLRLVRAQPTQVALDTMRHLESNSLQTAFALGAGERLAMEEGRQVGPLARQLEEEHATELICQWADKLEKYRKVAPEGLAAELAAAALDDKQRVMAIDAFVNSLTSVSGSELVATATRVPGEAKLIEKLLIKGYGNWLREDSKTAGADLRQKSAAVPDAAYDEIVTRQAFQLSNAGDMPSARQWAGTVRNDERRAATLMLLEAQEPR